MQEHYDIVVIGGGIHGAGALQAAAAAGYSCLLLEQYNNTRSRPWGLQAAPPN
jgi:glycerol-3-phosphate dehydrogenase